MEKANPDSLLPPESSVFVLPPVPADKGRAEALPLIRAVRLAMERDRDRCTEMLEHGDSRGSSWSPDIASCIRSSRENSRARAELLLQAELALGRAD